jgi:hypothetical protein
MWYKLLLKSSWSGITSLYLSIIKKRNGNVDIEFGAHDAFLGWLLGGYYPRGLIVHQQRYRPSDSNKNVDIELWCARLVSEITFIRYVHNEKVGKPYNLKVFESKWSHGHWWRAWRCLRVNDGILIGLRACKQAQLTVRLTVRKLTRPCIPKLLRQRRKWRTKSWLWEGSVISGDILRGLPEQWRSKTVLLSLWRLNNLDTTVCDTPNWLAISVQLLTYVWASSKWEYEWSTLIKTTRETARNLFVENWIAFENRVFHILRNLIHRWKFTCRLPIN